MRLPTATLKRIAIALWPALFLAAVILAVFATTLFIRSRTFYVFPDNVDQFYAWYQKLAYAVHHGALPIWDANVSAGHSFVGELQAGVFYPINILWVAVFGSAHGISVYWLELIVVFHFWLAALGMYYAGRSFGLGKAGGLAAALAYALGGGVAMRSVSQTAIFFGICLIPWAVLWFNRWLGGGRKLNLVWAAVTLGLIILAGHIDPWYFACLLIAFLVLFRPAHPSFEPWLKTTGKRLAALVIVVMGSLVVALPQVALSAQYLPHAVRFVGDSQPIGPGQKVSLGTFTKQFSFKLPDTLSVFDPVQYPVVDGNEIYVGLAGLTIVVGAAVLARRRLQEHITWRLHGRFLLGAPAVAAVVMVGYWTFIPALLRELPLFSQVRQLSRYAIIIQFCLALLVGIGVEALAAAAPDFFRARKRLKASLAIAAACAFLACNTVYLYFVSKHTGVIDKHFVYQNAVLVLGLAGYLAFRSKARYALLAAVVLSSLTQPIWFMPRISSLPATYAPTYYRHTAAIAYLERFYGQARVLVEDNALPVNIGDVYNVQTVGGYGATLHESFYRYLNEPDPEGAAGEHMDLLNVRFLVSKQQHPEFTQVFYDKANGIYIYGRPNYLPRAYFAADTAACRAHTAGCTPIAMTKYADSDIKLRYTAGSAQTLVLSEVQYKGWKAYVDGKATPTAAYGPAAVKLFRSVAVPAGSHTVEFRYRPFGL
ncbi:MAG TPA: YfhO family protein [Candidatus Saccharimonadales bacterium]|nr:YfhO family protein [Candidatus Saccharimonadales bacterium]